MANFNTSLPRAINPIKNNIEHQRCSRLLPLLASEKNRAKNFREPEHSRA